MLLGVLLSVFFGNEIKNNYVGNNERLIGLAYIELKVVIWSILSCKLNYFPSLVLPSN